MPTLLSRKPVLVSRDRRAEEHDGSPYPSEASYYEQDAAKSQKYAGYQEAPRNEDDEGQKD